MMVIIYPILVMCLSFILIGFIEFSHCIVSTSQGAKLFEGVSWYFLSMSLHYMIPGDSLHTNREKCISLIQQAYDIFSRKMNLKDFWSDYRIQSLMQGPLIK